MDRKVEDEMDHKERYIELYKKVNTIQTIVVESGQKGKYLSNAFALEFMKESMLLTRSLIAYGREKNNEPSQGIGAYLSSTEVRVQALYDLVAENLLLSNEQEEVFEQVINK
jgi:hypothetical protein